MDMNMDNDKKRDLGAPPPPKLKPQQKPHYVNNREFTKAVTEHVRGVREDNAAGREPRQISNYIGDAFLKIATGLSKKENFRNYTYRDDMVMDAVENCVLRINNFDPDVPTRTGKPNPFSYFTKMAFYAFLRRIAKENRQRDIKQRAIESSSVDMFADFDSDDHTGNALIESMRSRRDSWFKDENVSSENSDSPPPPRPKKKKVSKKSSTTATLTSFQK